MSSTLRLFLNDNRISTAVPMKNGTLLQVYPTKTTFQNEMAWREHWDLQMKPKIILKIGDTEKSASAPALPVPAPVAAARPSKSKKTIPASEMIFNTLARLPAPAVGPSHPTKKASLDDWKVDLKRNFSFTLPAGTYYIGDLCYVLGRDVYDNIFGGTGYESGIYEEKGTGRTFAVAPTAWGDGEFEGSDGNKFAVDAGIIGICSSSLMAKNDGGGHMYTFESPVKCHFKVGLFTFFWDHYNSLDIDTQ